MDFLKNELLLNIYCVRRVLWFFFLHRGGNGGIDSWGPLLRLHRGSMTEPGSQPRLWVQGLSGSPACETGNKVRTWGWSHSGRHLAGWALFHAAGSGRAVPAVLSHKHLSFLHGASTVYRYPFCIICTWDASLIIPKWVISSRYNPPIWYNKKELSDSYFLYCFFIKSWKTFYWSIVDLQ